MEFFKGLLGVCLIAALVLVTITLFMAIGLVIRVIAVIVAVVGALGLVAVLGWLAFEEVIKKWKKPR